MSAPRLAASLLVLAALPALALAAGEEPIVTQKQVVGAVRVEARAALAGFRAQADAVAATLDAALLASRSSAAAGASPAELANELVLALSVAQTELADAVVNAGSAVHGLAGLGLGELLGGQPSAELPHPFVRGGGGLLDRFRKDLERQVARTYGKLGKRLDKTLKALERQHGIAFLAIVTPASTLPHSASNVGSNASIEAQPQLDTLLAGSRLDTPGDGVLALSGRSGGFGGPIDVAATRSFDALHQAQVQPGVSDRRWTVVFDGLPEGNYLAIAGHSGDAVLLSASVGIR